MIKAEKIVRTEEDRRGQKRTEEDRRGQKRTEDKQASAVRKLKNKCPRILHSF